MPEKLSRPTVAAEPAFVTPSASAATIRVRSGWDRSRYVEVPDFLRRVPVSAGHQYWWTPRNADLLYRAARQVAAEYTDSLGIDDPDASIDSAGWYRLERDLPPSARRVLTVAWARQYIGCFTSLADRIAAGLPPFPACTGQMLALHVILDRAGEHLAACAGGPGSDLTGWLHVFGEVEQRLPRAAADYQLELLRDELLEDDDVLLLFDPAWDGIENDTELAARHRLVNLHPRDWFAPFPQAASVHNAR